MKRLAFTLMYALGLVRLAAWLNRRRVTILCYHGVTEREERSPRDPHGLHVRSDRFAAHLDYLRRHYNVISLRDYLKAREDGRALPRYAVVLTFDDGFRNFLTAAAPRLAERGLPVSVFLITDRIRDGGGRSENGWSEIDDEAYLSWEEARNLSSDRRIEFGSHACSHRKLAQLPSDEAAGELQTSQSLIKSQLGNGAMPLAYPYGSYSDAIIERARSLGYTCGLTTDTGANDPATDLFALRRVLIGDDDDRASFAARVSGLTGWLNRAFGQLRSGRKMI